MKKFEHMEIICTPEVSNKFLVVCNLKDFDNQVAINVSTFCLEVINYDHEFDLDKQLICSLYFQNPDDVFIIDSYECEEFDNLKYIKSKKIVKAGRKIV